MAEALKHFFSKQRVNQIAVQIAAVYPAFDSRQFCRGAVLGFEGLELMARAKQIALALQRYLPQDYPQAVAILRASLGPTLEETENNGVTPFLYLPYGFFVSEFGLDFFEESMAALYDITQRFTAEFSIRPFLLRYPERTLDRLYEWTGDPSVHVRRLVSEGTRPRLPWAMRLPLYQRDPSPLVPLLERLKDDPELYVRRSVANHLNDIGKDNPELLLKLARQWQSSPGQHTAWVLKHALRFAVKKGDDAALALLGFGPLQDIHLVSPVVTPKRVILGNTITVAAELRNLSAHDQALVVDFKVFYVKARGATSPKVFKLKTFILPAGKSIQLNKSVSLAEKTTRKHYPGRHKVEIVVNGQVFEVGEFFLGASELG